MGVTRLLDERDSIYLTRYLERQAGKKQSTEDGARRYRLLKELQRQLCAQGQALKELDRLSYRLAAAQDRQECGPYFAQEARRSIDAIRRALTP